MFIEETNIKSIRPCSAVGYREVTPGCGHHHPLRVLCHLLALVTHAYGGVQVVRYGVVKNLDTRVLLLR